MRKWFFEKSRENKGQAAIEFIAVSVVLFFFLLFFLSLSIVLVTSDYIDYATFMAARTYKTGASREQIQERNAKIVFDAYMGKIQGIARNFDISFDVRTEENNVRTSGVLSSYDMDLFYLPPIFVKSGSTPSRIKLFSETHLGRDPSFEECQSFFNNFIGTAGVSDPNIAEQMEDNGC